MMEENGNICEWEWLRHSPGDKLPPLWNEGVAGARSCNLGMRLLCIGMSEKMFEISIGILLFIFRIVLGVKMK